VQWDFYVVATKTLDDEMGTEKRIDLKGLEKLGVTAVRYSELGKAVEDAAGHG